MHNGNGRETARLLKKRGSYRPGSNHTPELPPPKRRKQSQREPHHPKITRHQKTDREDATTHHPHLALPKHPGQHALAPAIPPPRPEPVEVDAPVLGEEVTEGPEVERSVPCRRRARLVENARQLVLAPFSLRMQQTSTD